MTGPIEGRTEPALVYGIDVGNWNSSVVVGRQHATFDRLAAQVMPSAVAAADDGTLLAGWPAFRDLRHEQARYRRGLNRVFGQEELIWLGDQPVAPTLLMASLLRELRTSAEAAVPGTPARVAVAVPDDWSEGRRAAMRDAAASAGFDPQRIVLVDRPIAAAGAAADRMSDDRQRHILVYDFGGSCFACTVVRRTGAGRLVVLGQTATRADLGAAAFDHQVVAAMVARSPQVKELIDVPEPDEDQRHRLAGLQPLAESLKIRLSVEERVRTYVTLVSPGFALEIDRDAFQEAIRLSVTATVVTCEGVLARNELGWPDIDAIALAGGGANLPSVRQALATTAGRSIAPPHEPELAAATGAARQAGTEVRAARERRRSDPAASAAPRVTGDFVTLPPSRPQFGSVLAAWLVWALTGGWFTATHWEGLGMWLVLGAGLLIPVLLVAAYVARHYGLTMATFALGIPIAAVHLVTLGFCIYRAFFTDSPVGWIPFVATIVPILALLAGGSVVIELRDSVDQAQRVKSWVTQRRELVRGVVRDKVSGGAELPEFTATLLHDFAAARAFAPAADPFDFAIVRGRTLLLGARRPDNRPSPEKIASAVDAYLGPPGSVPVEPLLIRRYAQPGPQVIRRYAMRPINVHCFLAGDNDAQSQQYLAVTRPGLRDNASADRGQGRPAFSTTLHVISGGDLEDRMRRLLDRADNELYLPLLERAADAAGL